jgi:hypothetical protein
MFNILNTSSPNKGRKEFDVEIKVGGLQPRYLTQTTGEIDEPESNDPQYDLNKIRNRLKYAIEDMREDTKNMVSMAPTYDNFPKTSVPSISAFRMSNYSTSNAFNTGNNFNTQVYGSYENS